MKVQQIKESDPVTKCTFTAPDISPQLSAQHLAGCLAPAHRLSHFLEMQNMVNLAPELLKL